MNTDYTQCKGRYEDLEWSVISTDSDSRLELRDIENKVNEQLMHSSLDLVCNSITTSTDSNVSTDSSRELLEIETKFNNQLVYNNLDLNFSNITMSTENNDIVEVVSEHNYLEKIAVDKQDSFSKDTLRESCCVVGRNSIGSKELVSLQCNGEVAIDNREERVLSKDSDVTEIGSIVGTAIDSNIDRRETEVVELNSKGSMSSIEDEIKWLFGIDNQVNRSTIGDVVSSEEDSVFSTSHWENHNNREGVSSTNYRDIGRTVRYINSKGGRLNGRLNRRCFWRKWKSKIRNSNRNSTKKNDKRLYKEGIQHSNMDSVFDYCSKGLGTAEIVLLSKGSTFCIANNRVEEDRFRADIYAYSRRLRLHEEYRDQSVDKDFSQIFSQFLRDQRDNQEGSYFTQSSNRLRKVKGRKLPSTYDPDSQNRNLARYCNCIQEESILAINTKTVFKDNIDIEHRKALNSLKKKVEDREIIITLADKGSGIVVVDYDKYIEKGTKYIEEEAKAYSITDKSQKQIVLDIITQRNKIVKKLREHEVIEVDTTTYCMKQLEEKVTGMKFYYKVHKDTNIDTMPLRPLQSCIGSPTQHLSQVLTDLLQPFLTSDYIPTFIQDSNQLLYRLSKIEGLVENSTLISSDVAALYPSIPHKQGLLAVKMFLLDFADYNNTQINFIMQALELVITQNYVMWNGKIYTQDSGVAMGTPVAVAYANIFMDWIDKQLRQQANYIIEHIRYIDDNLFILPEDKIEDLMAVANSLLVPHIRFTYEKLDKNTDRGLPFLDTQLFISDKLTIESRLYTKKTDKHTYLLPTSFHPSHITKNIPMAVFNRIRRLCSNFEWFQADAMMAMQWLEDRGYKYADIKKAVEISSKKDRWDMIKKIEENRIHKGIGEDIKDKVEFDIPLIITYSHNARLLKEVLRKRQPLLDASFNQTKARPRLSYRRQRNINDLLIQKGLRKPILGAQVEEHTLELCGSKPRYRIPCPCRGTHDQQICRCCAHLRLKIDNIKIRLHKKVSCDSKNLIYVLGCSICNKLYVGETQQQLKERFLQHLNNIYKLTQPLYIHFSKVHKAENMYISVLESVRSGDHMFRKIREAWWINKWQTLEPRGFNSKLECNQIYQASATTMNIERRRLSKWT